MSQNTQNTQYIQDLQNNGLTEAQATTFAGTVPEARLHILDNQADMKEVLDDLKLTVGVFDIKMLVAFAKSKAPKVEPVATPNAGLPQQIKVVSPDDVEDYSPARLVEEYDVNNATNKVGKQLAVISRNMAFVVFMNDDKTVDKEATGIVLQEILEDEYDRKDYQGRDLHKVGQKPGQVLQENPLYPGNTLRSDGTCKITEGKWKKNDKGELVAPLQTRQTLWLAAKNGELGSLDKAKAKDLILKAHTADGQTWIAETYNEATKELRRLDKMGNAPKLQMAKETTQSGGRSPSRSF